jgi:hypothetical protein
VFWVGAWSILDIDLRNRLMPSSLTCEDSALGRWDPDKCTMPDYALDFGYFGTGLALMLLSGSLSSNAGVDVSTPLEDKCSLLPDETLELIYQRRPYVLLHSMATPLFYSTRLASQLLGDLSLSMLCGAGGDRVGVVAHHCFARRDGNLLGRCMYAIVCNATSFLTAALLLQFTDAVNQII